LTQVRETQLSGFGRRASTRRLDAKWRPFPVFAAVLPDFFSSPEVFRDRFEQGLVDLLRSTGELGEDILVLANAHFEPRIWDHLQEELRACFARLATEPTHGAPDDVSTLRAILDHGFDTLRPVAFRRCGPWELQHNPMRAFRPARHSGAIGEGIRAPFDVARFHFDKPFLRQEIVWEGALAGREAALFYNKFPFADYHGLLVPELAAHRPQFVEPADLGWLWRLAGELHARLPGFGFAYNSYGANASVNHLHFQTFLRETPLPVEDARWAHNGGAEAYPSRCLRCDDRTVAAELLAELHARATPYHLMFAGGSCYCLPRRRQGESSHAPWCGSLAWYEMAGGFPLADADGFARLAPDDIAAQIAAAAPEAG
jgi:hypothetical protein